MVILLLVVGWWMFLWVVVAVVVVLGVGGGKGVKAYKSAGVNRRTVSRVQVVRMQQEK